MQTMACQVDLSQEVFTKKAITVPILIDKLNLYALAALICKALAFSVRSFEQLIVLPIFSG